MPAPRAFAGGCRWCNPHGAARLRAGRDGSAELLGGAQVGLHVRWVLLDAAEPPPERVMTMRDAPVR